MAVRDNIFKKIYRSQLDNIVDDFFKVVLKDATYYERGTGYFSLSSIAALADGIIPSVRNNGTIKIITSVKKFIDNNKDNKLNKLLEKDILATNIYTIGYKNIDKNNLDFKNKIIKY